MQTITGRIVKFLPKQEGYSQRGHWVKAGFVIEYGDEYPKKAAFSLFGEDRLQMCKSLKEGTLVQVSYNPESREYQDRWYTELNCIRLQAVDAGQPASVPAPAPAHAPAKRLAAAAPAAATQMPAGQDENDLPF
jgi:hypothetical protein